jgi:hypothetical protein
MEEQPRATNPFRCLRHCPVIRSVAHRLDTQVGGASGVTKESMSIRATTDNPNPGGEAVRQVKVTSKIIRIDLQQHEVALLAPEGKAMVLKVEDPKLQERMKKLQWVGRLTPFIAKS